MTYLAGIKIHLKNEFISSRVSAQSLSIYFDEMTEKKVHTQTTGILFYEQF